MLTERGTFDPKVGAALTLGSATGVGNEYMIRIASRLAHMNGWTEKQVKRFPNCRPPPWPGRSTDATWKAAQRAGWSDEELSDAFAYVGATVFTGYFLNYARTDVDV